MYALTTARAITADDFDNWFRAMGELSSAVGILEAAAAAFVGLAHDTEWEARGVRALHDAIETSRHDAQYTRVVLQARIAELDRVGVA